MMPLVIVLCIIGAIMLLSKFLPDIFASILSVVGLIILAILVGGVVLVAMLVLDLFA